jgi:hypothetical protein
MPSSWKSTTPLIQQLPSNNELRFILQYVKSRSSTTTTASVTGHPNPFVHTEKETAFDSAVHSLNDLRNHIVVQLVHALEMEMKQASDTAAHYVETLVTAGFNYITLHDAVNHFNPP